MHFEVVPFLSVRFSIFVPISCSRDIHAIIRPCFNTQLPDKPTHTSSGFALSILFRLQQPVLQRNHLWDRPECKQVSVTICTSHWTSTRHCTNKDDWSRENKWTQQKWNTKWLSWQLHLGRTYLANILTRCSSWHIKIEQWAYTTSHTLMFIFKKNMLANPQL